MEVFARQDAVLCGIDEAKNLLAHVLADGRPDRDAARGARRRRRIAPKEVVLRIRARYRRFGLYETAFLGMLAQSTGWATAARECVEAAAPEPVIWFGARHVQPDITDVLDYAAIVGGCVGASTPAGARLAGLAPTGTMPHSLVLILATRSRPRSPSTATSVRTCRGSSSSTRSRTRPRRRFGSPTRWATGCTASARHAVGARPCHGGPRPRGPGTARPGGLQPRQDRGLGRPEPGAHRLLQGGRRAGRLVRGRVVHPRRDADRLHRGIKEIDGRPIAKRGRIPGLTDSPRLRTVDLAAYREG